MHLRNSYDSLSFEGNMKIEVSSLTFLSLDEIIKTDSLFLPNMRSFSIKFFLCGSFIPGKAGYLHAQLRGEHPAALWVLQGLLETFGVVVYACKNLFLITTGKMYCNLLQPHDKKDFLSHKTSILLQPFPLF